MYRDPASAEPETVLFERVTGLSSFILGLLFVGPLGLVFVGVLTKAVITMLICAVPFWAGSVIALAFRKRISVTNHGVRSRSAFGGTFIGYDDVRNLVVPHGSMAAVAATSGSAGAAAIVVYGQHTTIAVPADAPTDVIAHIVARALPAAVERAEAAIARGELFADPDRFSGIDAKALHGTRVGFTSTPVEVPLETVAAISTAGSVTTTTDDKTFLIGARDLVLVALIQRRGISIELPHAMSSLLP
ncbi:hypothetical protein BH09MYX1_BH09MYX1_43150 [soil metagenome]